MINISKVDFSLGFVAGSEGRDFKVRSQRQNHIDL